MDCDAILKDLNNKCDEIADTLKDLEGMKIDDKIQDESIDMYLDWAYDYFKKGDEANANKWMDWAAKLAGDRYSIDRQWAERGLNNQLERLEEQMHHLEEDYCKCKEENP